MLSLQLYEQIFNQHYSRLRYYAYKIVNNLEDSEDMVIESFEVLYNNMGTIPNKACAYKFLNVCLYHKCINFIKEREKRRTDVLNDDEYNFPERIEIEVNLVAMVYESIQTLSPIRKRIFTLLFKGMKLADVARELHISINTVKSQRKKAIDSIKLHLKV